MVRWTFRTRTENRRKKAFAVQSPAADFSVMTLNLRFGLADDGKNRWELRKDRLGFLFERHRPDFVGFQEANAFQIDFLGRLLPDHRFVGKRDPAPPFWQNNVLFHPVSWTCRWADHFFLSDTPDIPSRFAESRWPRQCTMAGFEKQGRLLVCINTHFDFDSGVQAQSARILQRRLQEKAPGAPAVLMGDFNATPDSPCHQVLTGIGGSEDSLPCFQNAFAPDYPWTFHGFSGNAQIGHIDWILYRKNLTPLGGRVITETFGDGYPSDHFPLLADFSFAVS